MGHSTSIPIDAPRKFILVGRSFIVCNSWLRVHYEQSDVSYHYAHDAPFQIQMSSGHDNILDHVDLQVMWDLLDGMLIRWTTAGATWGDGLEYFLLKIWTNLLQGWRLQIYIVKFLMMLWKNVVIMRHRSMSYELFGRKWSEGLQTGNAGVAPRGRRGRDHPLR